MSINFIDLHAQQKRLKAEIDAGIAAVLKHGAYVMGPEVKDFETKLAAFGETKYALGCANGTDAILMALMAWDIGPGDAVFCPSFTYCATAEVIANLRATPVFIDIDRDTYNMKPESLQAAITEIKTSGKLAPKAIIAVDLFGQAADYPAIAKIANAEGLKLIADSAQGFGTSLDGKQPAHWADITTTSFFPAKPLGCYGDGGAVLTNDQALAEKIDSIRIHGRGEDKYDNVNIGMNSRLDTLQIEMRNTIANRYILGLRDHVLRVPHVPENVTSTWAQFTIEVAEPAALSDTLREKGIPSARYYPRPIHRQTAYEHYPVQGNGLTHTEDCMGKVISLPMHPYLDEATQDLIIQAVIGAI